MGGFGSGRTGWRNTTGGALAIDLAQLGASGRAIGIWSWSLAGEATGSVGWELSSEALTVTYWRTNDEGRTEHIDRMPLDFTRAGFGGQRAWLTCPGCGRRCRVVYVGRKGCRCRLCYGLSYQSQRQEAATNKQAMAHKVARRIDRRAEWADDFPPKPKGMRWKTYWALEQRHRDFVAAADAALMKPLLARAA